MRTDDDEYLDRCAIAAMNGIMSCLSRDLQQFVYEFNKPEAINGMANLSYRVAHAMLNERNKECDDE
jgi:hypothetical protein